MEPSSLDTALFAAFRAAVRARIERDLAEETAKADALRARVLPLLHAAVAEARARGELGDAIVFGSFASGMPDDESDVDLLVEDCADPMRLAGAISLAIDRDVHVIAAESAPESLLARARADGARV